MYLSPFVNARKYFFPVSSFKSASTYLHIKRRLYIGHLAHFWLHRNETRYFQSSDEDSLGSWLSVAPHTPLK